MNIFVINSDMPFFPIEIKNGNNSYQLKVQGNNCSDGYYTFDELYDMKLALTIALFHFLKSEDFDVYKSKFHNDGSMFENYFVIAAQTFYGQISFHYKLEHWDKFKIPEIERLPWKYDNPSAQLVIQRLSEL